MSNPHRLRLAAAWLVSLYFTQLFLRMGWGKFGGDGFWTTAFAAWGYPAWFRILVGGVEVTAGVALLVPLTASYGAIALGVVMMGAWSTLAHDLRWRDMATVAVYGALLGWVATVWWPSRFRRHQSIEQSVHLTG